MDVKPGYKKTETGIIPDDWEVKVGNEITSLIGKGASPRWQGFNYSDHGMLFVTSENVRDGFLDIREPKFLPLAFHEKLKRTKLQRGDILVNLVGASIGRSCQIKEDLGDANVNQAVGVFRVKEEYCSAYVACCFQAPTTIRRILEMQVDAARPNFSLGDLRRFLIPLPSSPEQRAIATALSDVDALLGALERLIAKKRDLKQAAMQQLLTGQTRLPGFTGEWGIKPLGELTTLLTNGFVGTATNAYVEDDDGVLYIQGYNIQVNGFNFHGIKRVSKAFHICHQKSCLQAGDLLTIQTGAIGVTAVVPAELTGANCHALVISRFNKRWSDPQFYSQYFNSERGQAAFKEIETGTTMKHLNCGDMKDLMMPAPSLAEQTAIASVLSDMDAELSALEQRLAKTRALKQGMMQELLTGKTRLI